LINILIKGEDMRFAETILPYQADHLKEKLPLPNQSIFFVAINDFFRKLYAAVLPDKTQYSSANFLN
jgi:hypothetical protein